MRLRDATIEDSYYIHDTPRLEGTVGCVERILDAKYEPADLDEVVVNCTHLTKEQKAELFSLFKRHESLFDGTLGTWKGEITILNYVMTQSHIMLVLFQFHVSMNKPYDMKSSGYVK